VRLRHVALAALLFGLFLLPKLRPFGHVALSALGDETALEPVPAGHADDASRLNLTAVAQTIAVDSEERVVAALRLARERGWRVSIAGARHSQGGHTIAAGGLVLDLLPLRRMTLDDTGLLRVQAGAMWAEILPFLNARGRSIAVMQSDHSFTVGGSVSVNCHGWQHDAPPIASTVRAIRLVTPDGAVRRCSRSENAELFRHALGGYGLFGVIVEVEMATVPNELYTLDRALCPAERFAEVYRTKVTSDVGMVYGRLCVAPDAFLGEAILNVYRRVPGSEGKVHPLPAPEVSKLRRAVFRGSAASAYGKRLRWDAEKRLEPALAAERVSRNELLHQGVEAYLGRSRTSTDILQEYFVPRGRLAGFVARLRDIVPRYRADLLNVTVRSVARDDDTALRYADDDMFAVVMFYEIPRTSEADAAMAPMTREIVDAALALGGRHYLPYRLQATREQVVRAYPALTAFAEAKRRLDPAELLSNRFWERYGR
jgi:FAD/FMN-containing dehydrogenase